MITWTDQKRGTSSPQAFWIILAVTTLALAGALALSLVVGRAPFIAELIDDPRFFRRALVVHVVLSLWAWFFAYAAGLRSMIDGPGNRWRFKLARLTAAGGVGAMVVSSAMGAEPLLVNYIPVIDHPLFLVGLALFFGGAALEICRWPKARPSVDRNVPASAAIAWRAASVPMALGAIVFAITWFKMPGDLPADIYYELLFWGAGHTLIVVSLLVMLGAWFYLLRDWRGRSPVGAKLSLLISAALVAPWFAAPFMALAGPTSGTYIRGFTRLMQFGLAFPVGLALIVCALRCGRSGVNRAARWAFVISAAMTAVGFGLGAMIRGSDTMIPAHYHASLGAITVALMALTYVLLEEKGWAPNKRWWPKFARLQPLAFGVGQLVFALGFAIGGIFGADRKTYGSDQVVDSVGAIIGLGTMGIGGLIAVAGGGGFLLLMTIAARERLKERGS